MVIWVPAGQEGDATRPPAFYNGIAALLRDCGVDELAAD
jgi:hypothetical protein